MASGLAKILLSIPLIEFAALVFVMYTVNRLHKENEENDKENDKK